MAVATAPERVTLQPARTGFLDPDRQSRRGVEAPGQRGPRWSLSRTAALCGVIVVVTLLLVVAASAYLTQGQVRLTRLQGQLTSVLGRHHDLELRMATLSNPSDVVAKSERHGLVAPTKVTDLTQVNVSNATTTTSTAPTGHSSVETTGGP